jgi:hypothetical protein
VTITEARLRGLLQEMAEEAQPVQLLTRLERRAPAVHRRRAVVTALAVAAVALVAVAATVVQARMMSMPQPAYEPPEVFELGTTTSTQPGTAWMAMQLTEPDPSVYVTPAGGGATVAVPPRPDNEYVRWARLSPDGSHLVRVNLTDLANTIEVVNLGSGQVVVLEVWAHSAEISPDNRTVAVVIEGRVDLVDVVTGASRTVRELPAYDERDPDTRGGLGWDPDGARLATHDGAGNVAILDANGREQDVLAGAQLVNGSQSWSPDGRSILVYDSNRRGFAAQPADGGEGAPLTPPADAVRPLGWAGDHIVWLVGEPGSQRLVTADIDGERIETWLRFEVGEVPIESVTWSRALSG